MDATDRCTCMNSICTATMRCRCRRMHLAAPRQAWMYCRCKLRPANLAAMAPRTRISWPWHEGLMLTGNRTLYEGSARVFGTQV